MQQELKNIFVTKEVAKLAKEKGFNEICVGYFDMTSFAKFVLPNSDTSHNFILQTCDNPENFIEAPTHFQLIQWLITNYKIYVFQVSSEKYKISFDIDHGRFAHIYRDNINDALIFALNQINQQQNGK